MKKTIYCAFISLFVISLVGCVDNTSARSKEVIPTSMSSSVESIEIEINESFNLNEKINFTFEPANTTNKNVMWTYQRNEYFYISDSILTATEKVGVSTITATSASNPQLKSNISVIVKSSDPAIDDKSIKYDISYNMGSRKTSYLFKQEEIDLLKDTFIVKDNKTNIIEDISDFSYIYGGGYGGKGDTAWYQGDMLKFGTTSTNGNITLDLEKPVNKAVLTGFVGDNSCKIQLGSSNSTDWESTEGDNKTTLLTCSSMNEASKEVVEGKDFTSIDAEFDATSSLRIETINKKVFYLTSIELFFSEEKTYTVTWVDENGTVLETDTSVKEGSMPSYDGEVPHKDGFIFNGWTPSISKVTGDVTYVATYIEAGKTYTVIWKNENGAILETDIEVPAGTMPSYDGETPTKQETEDYYFIFNGWSPNLVPVSKDAEYTAKYIRRGKDEKIPGINPVVSDDKKTIQYGLYPQTYVNDVSIINELNNITPSVTNNWCYFGGDYYTKITTSIYNSEQYAFKDGTTIIDQETYWFKCEPITWKILKNSGNDYILMSLELLDAHNFYSDYQNRTSGSQTIYPNNYKESLVRNWLNDVFYNSAFSVNNSYITTTLVDNSGLSTDLESNLYVCESTNDKVFLPSYSDMIDSEFGFDGDYSAKSNTRTAVTTDYARARGAWSNVRDIANKYNGSYWTRSPSSNFNYCCWNVNSGGYLSEYAVDGRSHSIRPCITITFNG